VGRHGACADGGSHAKGAGGLLHNMVTRFMGFIVIAMGVQVALTGFHQFFS
jgi:small neutral amino acid transporter SnatA (MarC family)